MTDSGQFRTLAEGETIPPNYQFRERGTDKSWVDQDQGGGGIQTAAMCMERRVPVRLVSFAGGWRWCDAEEKREAGDMLGTAFGEIVPQGKLGKLGDVYGDSTMYVRRWKTGQLHSSLPEGSDLHAPLTAVTPGEGYRLLEPGEMISKAAEYWHVGDAAWLDCPFVGESIRQGDWKDSGVRVPTALIPGDGYRLLKLGDTIPEGAEYYSPQNGWQPTISVGQTIRMIGHDGWRVRTERVTQDKLIRKTGEVEVVEVSTAGSVEEIKHDMRCARDNIMGAMSTMVGATMGPGLIEPKAPVMCDAFYPDQTWIDDE